MSVCLFDFCFDMRPTRATRGYGLHCLAFAFANAVVFSFYQLFLGRNSLYIAGVLVLKDGVRATHSLRAVRDIDKNWAWPHFYRKRGKNRKKLGLIGTCPELTHTNTFKSTNVSTIFIYMCQYYCTHSISRIKISLQSR